MKKNNNKGFTLMEMLIVVAIIAILIAIAIPTFSSTLERSREAADGANIRSAYADAMANMLTTGEEATVNTVPMTQSTAGWVNEEIANAVLGAAPAEGEAKKIRDAGDVTKGDIVAVTVNTEGVVSFGNGAESGGEKTPTEDD